MLLKLLYWFGRVIVATIVSPFHVIIRIFIASSKCFDEWGEWIIKPFKDEKQKGNK